MNKLTLPFLIIILLISGCKNDDPDFQFPASAITISKVFDVGNNSDFSDIRVDFNLVQVDLLNKTKEIRIYLAKGGLTAEQASTMASDRYAVASLPGQDKFYFSKLINSAKDTDGDPIMNGINYNAYIFLQAMSEDEFLSEPKPITLEDKPIYAGKYSGIWNDALFSNFKVSMILNNDYSGAIFYSSNFTTCCPKGGTSDAVVQFVINGTQITYFKAMQSLGDYKGGSCEGTYTAQGEVTDEITLTISNLTGTDCDGDHTPGKVVFTRQ